MKHRFALVLVVLFVGFSMIASCQNPEPRSILKKAIAAHGGEKNIGKPRMGVLKGISKAGGHETREEETFDLPKRWKTVTTDVADGKTRVFFVLVDGEKHWDWEQGVDLPKARERTDAQSHIGGLTMLLDLTGEKIKLIPLERKKIVTVHHRQTGAAAK